MSGPARGMRAGESSVSAPIAWRGPRRGQWRPGNSLPWAHDICEQPHGSSRDCRIPAITARNARLRADRVRGVRGWQVASEGKGRETMANRSLHLARRVGIGLAGAVAIGLGAGGLSGPAAAQQAPAAKKAPAAAPAQKGAPAAAAPAAQQSAWVKLCEKAATVAKDKDGKDEKKEVNICLTHHERLDGNTGMVLVSAAIRQVEGVDKQAFMVMVPLGMMLPPGMRASIYPKEAW